MFLTLIRHASASNKNIYNDFDRPLTTKGIKKIEYNSLNMENLGWSPDLIITSSAVRAVESAEVFLRTTGRMDKTEIIKTRDLYLPEVEIILEYVKNIKRKYKDVFIFSHNMGISLAAQLFSNDRSIIMPTGAVVRIEFNLRSWRKVDFGLGGNTLILP